MSAAPIRRDDLGVVRWGATTAQIPDGLSFDEWQSLGRTLGAMDRGVRWWIGAWIEYGETAYGSKYEQAAALTGLTVGDLRNIAWVHRQVPPSVRTDKLDWSHHLRVAALEPDEQARYLGLAVEHGWSVKELRSELKRPRPSLVEAPHDGDRYRLLTCSVADLADELEPGSVDAIVTDPPYGAGVVQLYADLAATAARVLKPGGMAWIMCGHAHLFEFGDALREHLTYVWMLSYLVPGGSTALHGIGFAVGWKPVVVFSNGPRQVERGVLTSDVVKSPAAEKGAHAWQQSVGGMASLVKKAARPGQLVCDPFLGSGTTGVAALAHGCRFVGCDVDDVALASAAERLAEVPAA
jgi:16S rRNA G966 N2-methylase RsmD